MKVLKFIAILLVVLVGLFFVLALVAPSELKIEKTETINAPASAVYANVSCLNNWPEWSAWAKMDPEMKNEYSENPCGAGAWNSWDGEKAGKGKQTIEEANEAESLIMSLVFEGFEGTNYANWKFEEVDGVTTVTWSFDGAPSPFMFRPMNLMMKGALEDSYSSGLAALKEIVEANPTADTGYDIQEVSIPASKGLLISADVEPKNIGEFYANSFGMMMGYMEENGLEMVGQPSGLFYNWTDTLAKMSAAVGIDKEVSGNSEIEYREFPDRNGIMINYYGAYDQSGDAHMAMETYMEENGLELDGHCIETYVTDPMEEPDTSKWLTVITYPIKAKE